MSVESVTALTRLNWNINVTSEQTDNKICIISPSKINIKRLQQVKTAGIQKKSVHQGRECLHAG